MSRYFEPLPHFRWLVSAAARSWQLLRDSEPPIKGHILDGSLEAHRVLMLSRWKKEKAVKTMRNRPHVRDIIGDLERIAHEAAHCYRVIGELEGKDALPDPDNHPVLKRQLEDYNDIWQDIWHRSQTATMTLAEVIARQGRNPDAVLAEIAATNAKLDALGLVLDSDPRRVTKTGSAQSSDPAIHPSADADTDPAQADLQD